jgi:RHS repeat-associated protein
MGRRILRTVSKFENNAWAPDNQTRYVYQHWNVIWETITHAQAPQETNRYFWGLDLSGTVQGAGGVGGLLAVQMSPLPVGEGQGDGIAYFAYYDGNGNVMQYTELHGTLVAAFEYDPFGKINTESGILASKMSFRLCTKPECGVSEFNYYGYRFYLANKGVWLSRDPISEEGGENMYNYVSNNTINSWDYLGLIYDCLRPCGLQCGGLIGGAYQHCIKSCFSYKTSKCDEVTALDGYYPGYFPLPGLEPEKSDYEPWYDVHNNRGIYVSVTIKCCGGSSLRMEAWTWDPLEAFRALGKVDNEKCKIVKAEIGGHCPGDVLYGRNMGPRTKFSELVKLIDPNAFADDAVISLAVCNGCEPGDLVQNVFDQVGKSGVVVLHDCEKSNVLPGHPWDKPDVTCGACRDAKRVKGVRGK